MCGIAGILHLDAQPASQVLLRRMTDAIAHRGPDGEGQLVEGAVGLGHRRLAILDLTPAGHQPMPGAGGRYVITFNGEIYNFMELRAELESRGHGFRSRTDTEVVLAAFAEWGEHAVERLNGMFAFAIWDRERRELFLARDRYGVKPLYYTLQGQTLLFGSEVKAILAHPDTRTELDRPALLEYFTFQNFFTDRTLYKGVRILPAGTFMRVGLGGSGLPEPTRYWDFQFTEPEDAGDEREYAEELDRLFRQAVNRQLVSDVEVGAYLSGGMDSGSITALAAKQIPDLKTFTC
ncbi:MAG: asparagine synthase (glutamine-hydrolyzing), partial [Candidatus Sericytochromatia bacterium]